MAAENATRPVGAELVTIREAADILHRSKSWVLKEVRAGRLPAAQWNTSGGPRSRMYLIAKDDIVTFLARAYEKTGDAA